MIERIPQLPPPIKPLTGSGNRPVWSVMIPTYNCGQYLEQTLLSVLAQAPPPEKMQICVIDDFSTDQDVEAIVKTIGKGRVDFFKQEQNVGSLRNFETCINKSTGKLVHILHGDDLAGEGFYTEIEKLFTKYPSIGAAFTGIVAIDENGNFIEKFRTVQKHEGIVDDWLMEIAKSQFLQTCGVVVKRSVYEDLGGFYKVHYGEDWEMWVRIASRYPVAYSPAPRALYRVHSNNISSRYLQTGQNIKDIKTVIDTIQYYLPPEKRKENRQAARKNFAVYFSENAHKIYRVNKNKQMALAQTKGSLLLYFNRKTLISFVKMRVKVFINYG
jgi:glycosyltransferase involved in cell wall biosynthesis